MNFVHKLSGVYRYLLQSNEKNLISLKEELTFLDAYLHLLQTRFGKGLQTTIDIRVNPEDYLIPPLTLQLLVENAVKHNIVSVDQPLVLEVYTINEKLVVKNNLQKRKSPVVSHHIGLVNLFSRYQLITSAELEISETEQAFIVTIPLIQTGIYEGVDH